MVDVHAANLKLTKRKEEMLVYRTGRNREEACEAIVCADGSVNSPCCFSTGANWRRPWLNPSPRPAAVCEFPSTSSRAATAQLQPPTCSEDKESNRDGLPRLTHTLAHNNYPVYQHSPSSLVSPKRQLDNAPAVDALATLGISAVAEIFEKVTSRGWTLRRLSVCWACDSRSARLRSCPCAPRSGLGNSWASDRISFSVKLSAHWNAAPNASEGAAA